MKAPTIKITNEAELTQWEQTQLFEGDLPTTTVNQARLQVFQSSLKPKMAEYEIQTAWGKAVIKGRLGQSHATLLEFLQRDALDYRFDSEGRVLLLVDPYILGLSMSKEHKGNVYSKSGILDMIEDMRTAIINLYPTHGSTEMEGGNIIARIDKKREIAAKNPGSGKLKHGPIDGERTLWRVVLHESWVKFIARDIKLYYDPKPISELSTGIAQAIARFIATHQSEPNGGWHVDGLIQAVGAGKTSKALWDRRADLEKDAEGLKKLGITIEDGKIRKKPVD
jgi:hypothetical protein